MTQESEQLDAALFPTGEPTDSDAATLLAQYKIFVETSETLGARRQGVNTFFLSVNSLVLAAVGLLLREGQSGNLESGALIGLGVGGVTLCFVWRRLIASFRQLSRGKFDVIHALERRLPAQIFKAEWTAPGEGNDPMTYAPFTKTEKQMPLIFGLLQLLVLAAGIYTLIPAEPL